MNPEALELFNKIINKAPSALTEGDLEFLRARSSYVSAEVIERLGLDLKKKNVVIPEVEDVKENLIVDDDKKVEESGMDIDVPTKVEEVKLDQPSLEALSYGDLKLEAKALGLKYTAVSRENLIKSITAKLTQVNSK